MPVETKQSHAALKTYKRKYPIGAETLPDGGAHFRVWAPKRKNVDVVLLGDTAGNITSRHITPLMPEEDGYFSGFCPEAGDGVCYKFRLDGSEMLYPDPASRFQPEGPHGVSMVIDPSKFKWSDSGWKGIQSYNNIIYEMHIGTFMKEGTYDAAIMQLPELASLGITIIEIMPIAEFPGMFGWGYDGVDLFAPTRLYGVPDNLRNFVDQAHANGLAVILDVVYNHFGPDGNYLKEFSDYYFTDKYKNEWGEPINFDGENSKPVRDFFISNASYWIEEFHFDGLRLDATQSIYDDSPKNILAEISANARLAAGKRKLFIVGENEPQDVKLVLPKEKGGYGIDCLWNDDFHHSARVAMTGNNEAYYSDYKGKPQEFISAAKYGFLYQGQYYKWQKQPRGMAALDLKPYNFCNFIENHDQVANSGRGLRSHKVTSMGRYKALTALLLLFPGIPMLFQGQEFASDSPFYYFADHTPDLAKMVKNGRTEFLAQFPSLATAQMKRCLPDPGKIESYEMSKLDFLDREKHSDIYRMHKDLIKMRITDVVFKNIDKIKIDGAVLSGEALLLRYFSDGGADRIIIVNLGMHLNLSPNPEPLLAPPLNMEWKIIFSTENPEYGGCGCPPLKNNEEMLIQGHSALVLSPKKIKENIWRI
ncbi:MAG TPA: malto-oligosyltrehalose trehalohydrolase [Ignavibacteriales bacterium]|nr:malto-oligosyltrehalose trehalohydrolase [Ignavibacteriales bacterium]